MTTEIGKHHVWSIKREFTHCEQWLGGDVKALGMEDCEKGVSLELQYEEKTFLVKQPVVEVVFFFNIFNSNHNQNSRTLRKRGMQCKLEHVRASDLAQCCSDTLSLHHSRALPGISLFGAVEMDLPVRLISVAAPVISCAEEDRQYWQKAAVGFQLMAACCRSTR